MRNFTIEITRERGSKKWWRVDVPGVQTSDLHGGWMHLRTQALSRAETVVMAQDLLGTWFDVEFNTIHIGRVTYRYRHLN